VSIQAQFNPAEFRFDDAAERRQPRLSQHLSGSGLRVRILPALEHFSCRLHRAATHVNAHMALPTNDGHYLRGQCRHHIRRIQGGRDARNNGSRQGDDTVFGCTDEFAGRLVGFQYVTDRFGLRLGDAGCMTVPIGTLP
jgi:hypothetical protein